MIWGTTPKTTEITQDEKAMWWEKACVFSCQSNPHIELCMSWLSDRRLKRSEILQKQYGCGYPLAILSSCFCPPRSWPFVCCFGLLPSLFFSHSVRWTVCSWSHTNGYFLACILYFIHARAYTSCYVAVVTFHSATWLICMSNTWMKLFTKPKNLVT